MSANATTEDDKSTEIVESNRRIIEQQSALVQSLNDEINRIARLHAVTLGVVVTGVSLGVKAGVIHPGIAVQKNWAGKLFVFIPLFAAGIVGFSEVRLLWRGGLPFFEDSEVKKRLPETLPKYYSELELQPTQENIKENEKMIEKTEGKIGILHLHFVLLILSILLWIGIHALIF